MLCARGGDELTASEPYCRQSNRGAAVHQIERGSQGMKARNCRSADPRLHPTASQARPIGSLTTCCPLITVCLCLPRPSAPTPRAHALACMQARERRQLLPSRTQAALGGAEGWLSEGGQARTHAWSARTHATSGVSDHARRHGGAQLERCGRDAAAELPQVCQAEEVRWLAGQQAGSWRTCA